MSLDFSGPGTAYPLADTEAVAVLNAALDRVRAENGLTQRDIAGQLGYKGSVVLSHMASGRVPIPLDRATVMAEVLGLDPRAFLLAVLEQRFPEIGFKDLLGITIERSEGVVARLEMLAGKPLELLDRETLGVIEQAVTSNAPARRWLTLNELAIVDAIRSRFPQLLQRQLNSDQISRLCDCIEKVTGA